MVTGDAPFFNQLRRHEKDILPTDVVYVAKKVSVHGTEYRVGAVIHTGWIDELPEFSSIFKIVMVPSSKVYFILERYVTIQFDDHYHSFQACKPQRECTVVMQQSEFKHYLPAHQVKLSSVADGSFYINPRCTLPRR